MSVLSLIVSIAIPNYSSFLTTIMIISTAITIGPEKNQARPRLWVSGGHDCLQ